jgi:outer membrane receptor protein involved in Fe transport
LLAASLLFAVSCSLLPAQSSTGVSAPVKTQTTVQITDLQGLPIHSAAIRDAIGNLLATTDLSGRASLACAAPCSLSISAPGFAPQTLLWTPGSPIRLRLGADSQQVSVTAYRTPMGDLESPVSTRVLTGAEVQQAAGITLDGQLRLVPGVETFRRSSSLVANPSSQGLSLRGLGSTSASRTLVTEDDVPLNDAFGGWIHWQEIPDLSIRSVEVVRGGASDLYGSSAIGGVVNVLPQRPTGNLAELKSSYGSENTYEDDLLAEGHRGPWGVLASGGTIGTDGFIQLAPAARGVVDVPSNVHAQNGLFLLDHQQGALRLFLRGNGLNEARGNGTPLQVNGTRLWRYATGSDWTNAHGGALTFRAYGSTEHYRQTFSTINTATPTTPARSYETLNRFALTPDNELGAVLHWSQPIGHHLLVVLGSDTHDVRADDQEVAISKAGQSHVNLSDRQRQTGAYAEALITRNAWTLSGSARVDWFSNFDGYQWSPSTLKLPRLGERVFDPRLGLSRKLGQHFALSVSAFRAYRAPTPNELYRSTQVGSLLTYPNASLQSERATGWETGVAMQQRWGTLRTSYFWNQVNRPITALTINDQVTPHLLMRENLGQIESRGISADIQLQPTRWMTMVGGYQHTNATVTQYSMGPGLSPTTPLDLVGNWIPQVAHNMGTLQVRGYKPSIGTLSLQGKISGHQFDDDANTYLLHGYFKLDAYASRDFGRRWTVFTSAENLLNRNIEVGRTPSLTLGMPRVARGGFLLHLGSTGK